MRGHSEEHVLEVRERRDINQLAALDEGIEERSPTGAFEAAREQPILTTPCCAKTRSKPGSRKSPHSRRRGDPLPSRTSTHQRPHKPRLEPTSTCVKLPPMDPLAPPLAVFLPLLPGWINRQQQAVIEYLRAENRVLRAAYGPTPECCLSGKVRAR